MGSLKKSFIWTNSGSIQPAKKCMNYEHQCCYLPLCVSCAPLLLVWNQQSGSISVMSADTASSSSRWLSFRWRRKQDAAAAPQFTVKAWTQTFVFTSLSSDSSTLSLRLLHTLYRESSVSLGAWLPSRLWSSGVNCSVMVTEMWPSPTWRPPSRTEWLSARLYTSTDPTWCEYFISKKWVKFGRGLTE